MKQAADLFVGTKDFRSFTALKSKNKSTVRTISKIEILKKEVKSLSISLEMVFFIEWSE